MTYPKTCRKHCLSASARTGIVTNQPDGFDLHRAHMSQSFCERPECLKRALREVREFTGEEPTILFDSDRAVIS
jgi:hypothetical protein